jgi:predicted DNA-binding transcriptional regulator AlpA
MTDNFLLREDVARAVGVSPRTIANWSKQGRFPPPVRLGTKTVRYPESAVRQFIDEAKAKAVGPSPTRTGPGNEPESLAV